MYIYIYIIIYVIYIVLLTATRSDANFPCALFMALPKLHTRVIIHDNEYDCICLFDLDIS